MVGVLLGAAACGGGAGTGGTGAGTTGTGAASARFPLELVADVDLPGKAVRFDYEDVDPSRGHLVIAHMNDASVDIIDLASGSTVKVLPNIPVARGIVVGDSVGRIFVTS